MLKWHTDFLPSAINEFQELITHKDISTEKIIEFDKNRNIYDFWMWNYIVEYTDFCIRNEDLNSYKNINIENTWNLQNPEISWYLDFKEKYYIILKINKNPSWETNDFIYEWIIMNPTIFLQNQNTKNKINDLI